MTFSPKPKPTKKAKEKKRGNGVKITDPDKWFSLCVRERADWTCERCGRQFAEEYTVNGLRKAQGLHCSHYFGRGNWAVRLEPLNAWAHCKGCHDYFEANAYHFTEWVKERLGIHFEVLVEKANSKTQGKVARHEQSEIAAHYKKQYERMRKERDNGRVGRISFQGYF